MSVQAGATPPPVATPQRPLNSRWRPETEAYLPSRGFSALTTYRVADTNHPAEGGGISAVAVSVCGSLRSDQRTPPQVADTAAPVVAPTPPPSAHVHQQAGAVSCCDAGGDQRWGRVEWFWAAEHRGVSPRVRDVTPTADTDGPHRGGDSHGELSQV